MPVPAGPMPNVMSWPRMFFRYWTWLGVRPARSARRVRRRRSTSPASGAPPALFAHRLEDRELDLLGADRPRRPAVEMLQQHDRALGVALGALDAERLVAALDLDVERGLDRAQVLVEIAGQVGEAVVVGRDEGVAKDHVRRRGARGRDCRPGPPE